MRNVMPTSAYRFVDQIVDDRPVDDGFAEDRQWLGQEAGLDFLSLLSATNRRRILAGSTRVVYPAGTIVAPGVVRILAPSFLASIVGAFVT